MKEFKGFTRGVNLGGWFSQCDYSDDRLNNFIVEEDFSRIAALGLDHVRLPFDFNIIESKDGSAVLEEGYAHLSRAIGWARKYGLNIILDLHKTAGFSFDDGEAETGFFESEAYQNRFYAIWEQMATRFGHDPEHVAFELLNEVTDPAYIDTWNRVVSTCIAKIRVIAPEVIILVGSYWNNHVSAVRALDKPADDRIVYNFHCYEPLMFTHQGAPWVKGMDTSFRQPFTESETSTAYFEEMFAEAVKYAEEQGTVLYCGEYGVIDRANAEDELEWYKVINGVFTAHKIGRAAWTWKGMDFELCGPRMAAVLPELVRYM